MELVKLGGNAFSCPKIKPGLTSLLDNPDNAQAYLAPLTDCISGYFSAGQLGSIDVYLRATAGVRNLPTQADKDKVLGLAKQVLNNQGYGSVDVDIITGQDEGINAWLNVNDLLGTLGDPFGTRGMIEMGGASMQVVFAPANPPKDHGIEIKAGGQTHSVYAYSYPDLGINLASDSFNQPAATAGCFPKGVKEATVDSDFDTCQKQILSHPQFAPKKSSADEVGLEGVYQPPIFGNFISIGVFGTTAAEAGINNMSPKQLRELADKSLCGKSADELKESYPEAPLRNFLCFNAAYLSSVLSGNSAQDDLRQNGLGFPDTTNLLYATNNIAGKDAGWPRGVILRQLLKD